MKVYFNQIIKSGPWGGGNSFLINFIDFLKQKGHKVVFKLNKNLDLIFITSNYKKIDPKIIQYKKKYPNIKVLHRINECDKRKNTDYVDNLILKSNKIADETVFISNWLAEYFKDKGFDKYYKVIYNACNPKFFFPSENKILSNTLKLVTHHWSSNWMKGFDIYTKLDELLSERHDLSFTYIGNYYSEYTPQNTKVIPPLFGAALGEELRNYDIYITASRWEPCGMHHIEGARCGLPVLYHREGGGINEACKNYGLEFQDINSLEEAIDEIHNNYHNFRNKIQYSFLSSQRCNEEYYNILLKMFE